MPIISALAVSDPPDLWRDLGFTVDGSSCRIGSTVHDLGAAGDGGVLSWSLDGVDVAGDEVEGLRRRFGQPRLAPRRRIRMASPSSITSSSSRRTWTAPSRPSR